MSTGGIGPAGLARGEYGHVLQSPSRDRQVPFGRTTERFFIEGEEHEASQWEDTILPPDDEPEPKRWRGRIDKVPRQKGAMFVLVLFAACLAFGVGMGVSAILKTGTSVSDAVAAVRSWLPLTGTEPRAATGATLPQPSAMQATLATSGSEQLQTPTISGRETTQGASSNPSSNAEMNPSLNLSMGSQPVAPAQPAAPPLTGEPTVAPTPTPPGPVPVPAIVPPLPPPNPPAPTAPQKEATPQPASGSATAAPAAATAVPAADAAAGSEARPKASKGNQAAKHKKHRARRAEDNYVWSAELNALVPASSLENPQPRNATDASSERSNQSSVTQALRQMPNPFQKDDLSPPPLPHKASIAPATRGGPTDERPAPSESDPFEK